MGLGGREVRLLLWCSPRAADRQIFRLTPVGVEQSKAAAAAVRDIPVDVVLVSPLSRTIETAMHVFDAIPVPVRGSRMLSPTQLDALLIVCGHRKCAGTIWIASV